MVATARPGRGADGNKLDAVPASAKDSALTGEACCLFNPGGSLQAATATTSNIAGHRHLRSAIRSRRNQS